MAEVTKTQAIWQGFQGAPGYTNFYWTGRLDSAGVEAAGNLMYGFFQAIRQFFNIRWTIQVQQEAVFMDITTGKLTGAANMPLLLSPVQGTQGTASSGFAGGTGCALRLTTGGVHNGRRIRGKVFLVPAVAIADADGTILQTARDIIQTAGLAVINGVGADWAVFSRYYNLPPGSPGREQIGGSSTSVTGCIVPDQTAVMRSRRE